MYKLISIVKVEQRGAGMWVQFLPFLQHNAYSARIDALRHSLEHYTVSPDHIKLIFVVTFSNRLKVDTTL